MDGNAKAALTFLVRRPQRWITDRFMARKLGMSVRAVKRALGSLAAGGTVQRESRIRGTRWRVPSDQLSGALTLLG